ncbi:MAG TPA: glycosyltransferase family 4 protein [Vicinamibacterales bacterium]|nr:glycosyltransferase family 4 protein [Vicinamibacterales bacterium]
MAPSRTLLVLGALPPPIGGAAIYYDTLMKSKVTSEFNVVFLNIAFVDSIAGYGQFSLGKALRAVRFAVQLCLILLTRRVDLVYAGVAFNRISFIKDIILVAICRAFGRRVVGCLLGIGLERAYAQSGWFMKRFMRWGLSLYDAFVTPSLTMFARDFGGLVPVDKARCVPFGIFADSDAPQRRLTSLGDPLQVIYYSNFNREKGIKDALAAIPFVVARHPQVRFLFVGAWDSDAHKQEAMQIVESTGTQRSIRFSGQVRGDARRECLRESDIFLLPTYFPAEGLPLSILEAMSHGCAIITTDHAATTTAVQDGVTGLICRKQDPRDIALKINQLVEDRQLLLNLQQNSARSFRESFTAARFGETLARELGLLAERGRRNARAAVS